MLEIIHNFILCLYCWLWILHVTIYMLYWQTQEEVLDLKHAAPFQNIIPKPYIPPKGQFSAFSGSFCFWLSMTPSPPPKKCTHTTFLSCAPCPQPIFVCFKCESVFHTEMQHAHEPHLHRQIHLCHTRSLCCNQPLHAYAKWNGTSALVEHCYLKKQPVHTCTEGKDMREREQEVKGVMKQLEKKYAALQVVSVIKKLGNQTVSSFPPHSIIYPYC